MKIFYTADPHNLYMLDQKCPFNNNDVKVGSVACFHCKYCYGGTFGHTEQGAFPNPCKGGDDFYINYIWYVKCTHTLNKDIRDSLCNRIRCWIWRNVLYKIKLSCCNR